MIKTEYITVNGRELFHTYSDVGMKISRDGIEYSDALDPTESGRVYIETDSPIVQPKDEMEDGQ